jgi:hypothetical protein
MVQFPNTASYLAGIDINTADPLDKKANELLYDNAAYERASQALRRRFVRGAEYVEGVDRGDRAARIKRVREGNTYSYYIEGADGSWNKPEERFWVVAMYALWQDNRGIKE